MINLTSEKTHLFMSIFMGRTDVFARRWEKDNRSGYSPVYRFDWNEFNEHRRRGGSIKDFENKELVPLTAEVIKNHLLGMHVIGIYPILPDNTSYFLAADFDGDSWNKEAIDYFNQCKEVGLISYIERSRSGNGGHVWTFFSEPYPCIKSRQIGLELIRRTFGISKFEKEISFDRLFPNQDSLSKGGFGNLIALPFQVQSIAQGNTLFIDIKTEKPLPNQWTILENAKRHSSRELDNLYNNLFSRYPDVSQPINIADKYFEITVDNQITFPQHQLTPGLTIFLKDELNFINTEYLAKRQLGKSTYNVKKYFKLIDESEEFISLPRGFLNPFIEFLNQNNIRHTVFYKYPALKKITFDNTIELAPHQEKAVRAGMEYDQGIIVSPSGSGKTIIGLELIARRMLPALILVHRKQLLEQWVERIQSFLGIPRTKVGQYSGVKKMIGKKITVGLLQSFSRMSDLSEFKNLFGTIIVDECHHIPATTFRKVIAQLNPRYLYGLTATPKRKHSDEKLIYIYIGDIIINLTSTDVRKIHTDDYPGNSKQTGESISVHPLEVIIRTTNLAIPFSFSTDLFHILAKVICFDSTRNQFIGDDIMQEIHSGRKVLLLSERKDHLDVLSLYLKGKCEVIVITGDDSLRRRELKIKQIQNGHYQIILSTGQYFGEGIDVQGISSLILAFPFSFEGKLLQYIGRLRISGQQQRIIDYRDTKIKFLERQFKKRYRLYKKLHLKFREIF